MFTIEPLSFNHRLSDFESGQPALDGWLHNHARREHEARQSRVMILSDDDAVIGFYAITPAIITADGLPRSATRGFSVTPGWLIGRLAVATAEQGRGIGVQLLRHALDMIVSLSDKGAGRVIVVDPINRSAADWYLKYGFKSIGVASDGSAPRPKMFLRVDQVLQARAAPP